MAYDIVRGIAGGRAFDITNGSDRKYFQMGMGDIREAERFALHVLRHSDEFTRSNFDCYQRLKSQSKCGGDVLGSIHDFDLHIRVLLYLVFPPSRYCSGPRYQGNR